ncbi:thymidylate kinase-domain-containing protein [Syncephalis pseudoplumigaleata]|uniref:Thymidylate kinase n=1 Tax=Syncephalis pseudoplumigaleata TaxID=1712513 RepID=A0A4P9YYD5_9FUNG|nr:thymidylate kinase-domain-containing protein [Syncephalis pseudoplumigaleata]|eukprot:RKP24010.1 thymidylate kinase-domain-containing protein [Syncephalis pseudoplumigaleata]
MLSRMTRGAFILLEGGDRTGKSTQCRRLVEYLQGAGVAAQHRRFPGRYRTTTIGKMIDAYLAGSTQLDDRAIHLLFSANRWEAVADMKAALQKGITLVVDRYAYSGVAFSAAKVSGLSLHWCKQPDIGLLRPDLVCWLDMPVDAATQRGAFGQERYERVDLQRRVREYFAQLREPDWLVLDATQSVETVHEAIAQHAVDVIAVCQHQPLREDLWQKEEEDNRVHEQC